MKGLRWVMRDDFIEAGKDLDGSTRAKI